MRLTQIVCPKCQAALNSKAGIEEGTAIACPKCKQKFTVAAPEEEDNVEVVEEEEEEAPAKKSPRENGKPQMKKGKPSDEDELADEEEEAVDEEEADEEEKSKSKKAATDEPKPVKPKKKRKKKKEPELGAYGKLKNNIWVRIGVLGVLLAGLGLAIYIRMNREEPAPIVIVEKAPKGDEDLSKPIPLKKTDALADSTMFHGSWVATSVVRDGVKYPEQALRDFRYTVQPDMLIGVPPPKNDPKADPNKKDPRLVDLWLSRNDIRFSSTAKFDAAKSPGEIDLTSGGNNVTLLGIFRFINKDTLEICSRLEPGERPKEFAAPEGSKCLLMKLKRDKNAPTPGQFASDAQRFQGNWTLSEARSLNIRFGPDNRPADATGALAAMARAIVQSGRLGKMRIVITDDEWSVEDEPASHDGFTFDKSKSPAEIDFVRPDGVTLPGIYRFSNNDSTLEICVSWKGEKPRNFEPSQDSECLVCILKRAP